MIYALGEALLDVIIDKPDNVVMRPGGAMLNASVSLGRSGIPVSLLSELGDDDTANMLISFLQKNHVSSTHIRQYPQWKTTLALAWLDAQKKPSYTFYKSYPAQRSLRLQNDIRPEDILIFGSLYALDQQIRKDIIRQIEAAKKASAVVYYDPNIRHSHHLQDEKTRNALQWNFQFADIIKGSDEDFENIYGSLDLTSILTNLRKINKDALIIYTRGKDGVVAFHNEEKIELPALAIDVKSTVGAGDAFNAGFLSSLHAEHQDSKAVSGMKKETLEKHLESGLKYAAEVCSSLDNYIH